MPGTTTLHEKSRKIKTPTDEKVQHAATSCVTRSYISNAERGLGPDGGGWNISQAAHWSGFSEAYLRALIKRREARENVDIFPYYRCGRRLLIPRDGFKAWFNRCQTK
jgi:hypothetical protein